MAITTPYVQNVCSWFHVEAILAAHPPLTVIRIAKEPIPHPKDEGFYFSIGIPEDQEADYRRTRADGSGLHVKIFESFYEVHIDRIDPAVNFIDHLRFDAPNWYVIGMGAVGLAFVRLAGGDAKAMMLGAIAGVLLGKLTLPNALATEVEVV